jgi:hypothetical protein
MTKVSQVVVLSIAGSDTVGGAGIQVSVVQCRRPDTDELPSVL